MISRVDNFIRNAHVEIKCLTGYPPPVPIQPEYHEKVIPMKLKKRARVRTAVRAGIIISCAGIIFLFKMGRSLDSEPKTGFPTASAAASYGILGRQAPELNLNTWIDGDGKPIEPIKLGACRGKVIYLYFFQSW